ncbi:MAG: hypothetical protein K8R79_00775 [Calditrichales bacterium]|nr:hypothetical protein [Calditrichales bacterium]
MNEITNLKQNKLYKIIFIQVILLLLFFQSITANDSRLKAMGEMTISVPDIDCQINLYQFAGNAAWLKANDSLNWMRYTLFGQNEWGGLRRYWDARKVQLYYPGFTGQKHINENQTFLGEVRFNMDYQYQVNKAIEKNPYALDPFVLTDSTEGDFFYYGPEIFVAFSQRITPSLYLGATLYYNINRGLKEIYTRPEIIHTNIGVSLDIAYSINQSLTLGLSFNPYHIQNITKLVKQPDGQSPQTFRYRGEFEFRKGSGTKDRTAIYEGFEIRPQLAFQTKNIESVVYLGYYYQWHEIFDGTTKRYYDGNYQAQHYFLNTVLRYHLGEDKQTSLAFAYKFLYIEDWAKEPKAGLLFYQAFYRIHKTTLGLSHRFSDLPLEAAVEIHHQYFDPRKNDYLAHLYRKGKNLNLELHTGIEYKYNPRLHFRLGFIYLDYQEAEKWNYFGNYNGPKVTGGIGYYFKKFELDLFGKYGIMNGTSTHINSDKRRENCNIIIQLKHYF